MTTTITPSTSYKWKTPDGEAFVFIAETTPITVQIFIGKAGTSVASWAWALAEMTNFALEARSVDDVIEKLNDITTDRAVFHNGAECRSTAEALAFSLMEHKRGKRGG